MSFSRILIVAEVRTASPLHIGDGRSTTRPGTLTAEEGQPVEINSVMTDVSGKAYIPGSSLKGAIRSWLEQAGVAWPVLEGALGRRDADPGDALGGKLEFHDAFFVSDPNPQPTHRWWSSVRKTCIAPGIAIDRHTGTVLDHSLFHTEYVAEGTVFRIEVTGDNVTEDELALLVAALDAFSDDEFPQTLGAETQNGWGRLEFSGPVIIQVLEPSDVGAWFDAGANNMPQTCFRQLDAPAIGRLRYKAQALVPASRPTSLRIKLRLNFDGGFLINDPSRCQKEGDPNHAPLLNAANLPILLPRSIRGRLRSQAEAIFRTVRPASPQLPGRDPRKGANAEHDNSGARSLPLIEQTFGAAGWRTPISFSYFSPVPQTGQAASASEKIQEFVAIDRFTGGAADEKKFNAARVYRPKLEGWISVDLDALRNSNNGPEAIGLLLLTLRDLVEGDVPMGFGAAKGYAANTGEVLRVEVSGTKELISAFLAGVPSAELPTVWTAGEAIPPGWPVWARTMLSAWCTASETGD